MRLQSQEVAMDEVLIQCVYFIMNSQKNTLIKNDVIKTTQI